MPIERQSEEDLMWHSLMYKLVVNLEAGNLEYSFTPYRSKGEIMPVPCMSTCGMMISRALYNELGGWPEELGIYSGGEHFMNFTLAVLGKTVNIYPTEPLFHHGEKRGYHWYHDDYVRNRTIASYMFGGKALAARFIEHRKGNRQALRRILEDVFKKCSAHRELIKGKQTISIYDWVKQWHARNQTH